MKYSEIGFRGIYHHFWAIPLMPDLRHAVEAYPDIEKADHLLTYGYIDRDAGLTLEILAGARKNKNSFRFFDTNVSVRAVVRIGAVEDSEFYYFEDKSGSLKKRFSEKIETLSGYDADADIEKTRYMTFLDSSRYPQYPDDIQVFLMRDGLEPEACWTHMIGLGDHCIMGILLNEPNQNFGYHAGEEIAFFVHENEDRSVICCSNMTPSRKLTAEDLADGTLLKNAVSAFHAERNEENFLDVLEFLRDSYVWIPCNAIVSDADTAKITVMIEAAGDDPDSLLGLEIHNEDAIRLVPDILRNGESFFFPVFSSAAEMGEYGEHFSKVEKHMLEAIAMARNNDKKLSGIVLNAFTEPFILEAEIFDIVEKMKTRL